jgi:hypothetical protein
MLEKVIRLNKETAMKKRLSLFVAIATLSACITINIYFPAAAAEKAADQIIDDVWQIKDDAPVPAVKSEEIPAN